VQIPGWCWCIISLATLAIRVNGETFNVPTLAEESHKSWMDSLICSIRCRRKFFRDTTLSVRSVSIASGLRLTRAMGLLRSGHFIQMFQCMAIYLPLFSAKSHLHRQGAFSEAELAPKSPLLAVS
jgi:hypothetical protein